MEITDVEDSSEKVAVGRHQFYVSKKQIKMEGFGRALRCSKSQE